LRFQICSIACLTLNPMMTPTLMTTATNCIFAAP
jgi:hypothetical protein